MTQKTKKVDTGLNVRGPLQKNGVDAKLVGDVVTREETHTYAINSAGNTATPFVPFAITQGTGETTKLARVIYRCSGGTPTLKLQVNGSDATGFTGLSCSSTQATTSPTAVTLADKDEISAICSAGSWTGWLYITVVFTRAKAL